MATAQLFDEFDRRSWQRHVPSFDMTLTLTTGGRRYRGTVEDISIGGMKLRIDGEAPTAEAFTVEHPQAGAFTAKRVWQSGGRLALRFDFAEALPLLIYCAVGTDERRPAPRRIAAGAMSGFA